MHIFLSKCSVTLIEAVSIFEITRRRFSIKDLIVNVKESLVMSGPDYILSVIRQRGESQNVDLLMGLYKKVSFSL